MIRALYVKCQLTEMMKMIKGHQCEIETYMQHEHSNELTAWRPAGRTAGEKENK